MGLGWLIAGGLMFVSIFGIHYGKMCFQMAKYVLAPFGKDAISTNEFYGREAFTADCMSMTQNQIWFIVMGWWLALGHLIFAIINYVTLLGISSGRRHLQLACISISPLGKIIANESETKEARKQDALRKMRKIKNELSV